VSTSEEKKIAGPYHHGDLRAALVTAAAELVACCGAGVVSLREVARIVGVSHNAPYRHFPTREALLAAVAAHGFELLFEAMQASSREADPAEHLQACGQTYIAFALKNRGIYQLMFSDEIKKSDHPDLRAIAERAFNALQGQIADLHPHLDEGAATVTAWALFHGLAHLILDNQLKAYDEFGDNSDRSGLIDIATRFLTAGLINAQPKADQGAPAPSGIE
jgi:AcrR family transcriptional regulator